jgi:orotidine-5'-phosphate decarboxylase
MTSYEKLLSRIESNGTYLCVGLDSDIQRLPSCFERSINGLVDFNRVVIEQTHDLVAAYKINFAFYEQYGGDGFNAIEKTLKIVREMDAKILNIADAKRGDIGNTASAYARSVFGYFDFDAVTCSPYMGIETLEPIIEVQDKFIFVLALTSNKGANDFERLVCEGKPLYQHIIDKTLANMRKENVGFVVGATNPEELAIIRKQAEDRVLLIPGVGTQGGDIDAVMKANSGGPAVINVSRAVIYPKEEENIDFSVAVRNAAEYYSKLMKKI